MVSVVCAVAIFLSPRVILAMAFALSASLTRWRRTDVLPETRPQWVHASRLRYR